MQKSIFAVCIFICCITTSQTTEHRSKRFLTFPRTSPTRLQLIIGIGIPVQLKIESVTIGWVNKVEFFLPENASNFLNFFNDPFDLTTRPIYGWYVRRSIDGDGNEPMPLLEEPKPTEAPEKFPIDDVVDAVDPHERYERHQSAVEIVERSMDDNKINHDGNDDDEDDDDEDEEDNYELDMKGMSQAEYWNQEDEAPWFDDHFKPKRPKDLSKFRWGVYKTMAVFAESRGLPGKMCVLRSICESAHTQFDYSNGILGELMHILMTPSSTTDDTIDPTDNEYFYAEQLGKDGASCEHAFGECGESILDQFSGVYSPLVDIFESMKN